MATSAVETDRRAGRRDEVRPGARVGMAAHGLLYAVIGALAIGVALGWGGEITDQRGAMGTIAEQPFGEDMLLLALGLFAYAAWRVLQAVADRDDKGDDATGRVKRLGNAGKGLIAAGLGIAALRVVFAAGDGGNTGGGQGGATDPNTATSGVHAKQRRVIGADVFVESPLLPEALGRRIGGLAEGLPVKLKMRSNRGTQVYPAKGAITDVVDHWRCRFVLREPNGSGNLDDRALMELLGRVSSEHRWMHVEKPQEFDGAPAHTLAQGEDWARPARDGAAVSPPRRPRRAGPRR